MKAPDVVFPYLNIQINTLNRIAFTISFGDFSLPIYWYGIIIVSAIIIAYLWALREAKITGQNPDLYSDFLPLAALICIAGARLYYVIFSWETYKDNPLDIFATRQGGLAIYGGIIAAIPTAFFYAKRKKISFPLFTDTAAPSLALGQAIGRWGNFVNREVFGGYTESIFSMRYIENQVAVVPQSVLDNIVAVGGINYIQVHPTFLYESVWNLALFIFLQFYKKYKKFDGELLYVYLLGYGTGRFFIEAIRTDQLKLFATEIPVSMIVSAVLAAAALFAIVPGHVKYSKKGFTLLEMAVALGVIAVLTAILLPNVMNYLSNANNTAFHANAKTAYNAAVQVAASKTSGTGKIATTDKTAILGLLTGDVNDVKIVQKKPAGNDEIGSGIVYISIDSDGVPEAAYYETLDSVYPPETVNQGG